MVPPTLSRVKWELYHPKAPNSGIFPFIITLADALTWEG